MTPLFGAIADDLTGGTELAAMLGARGVPTGFTVGPGAALGKGLLAHVIALKSRVAPVDVAVRDVLAAADRLVAAGCRQIFFKYCATFDSTPTGNIGPCAEALLDRLGADVTLFCPALCEVGRTVYQGHMFAGRQLLSNSPKRFDPLTPMIESDLVKVLAEQSNRSVGLVGHESVAAGASGIAEAVADLRAAGVGFALVDTIAERDLAAIAEATLRFRLMTGNSSIAAHYPPLWRREGHLSGAAIADLPGIEGPAAVIAGSVAPRTAEQLAAFAATGRPVLMLDPARALAGEDLAAEADDFTARHLADGPIAIATTMEASEVAALQARYGRATVAAAAEALLSQIASRLARRHGVRRLVVAGGETAGAVLARLGIDRLTVGAYEGPGVARAVTSGPAPLALVLKSGKLGPPGMFAEVLEAMRAPASVATAIDRWPPSAQPQASAVSGS